MQKDEIRELITDILSGHIARIESQYTIIEYKLNTIEQNQNVSAKEISDLTLRVTKLENNDKIHHLTCPNIKKFDEQSKKFDEKIVEIQKVIDENKTIKKWLGRVIVTVGGILTIIWTYIKIKGGL